MEAYIRYKRICKLVDEQELNAIFREIVSSGSEIIYYDEEKKLETIANDSAETNEIIPAKFIVTIITGKKQSRIL